MGPCNFNESKNLGKSDKTNSDKKPTISWFSSPSNFEQDFRKFQIGVREKINGHHFKGSKNQNDFESIVKTF